jgi:DNA replication and repair protein RecF
LEQNNPFLQELHVVNFKNCRLSQLHLSSGFNCLVGDNGAGKTNLLDAIYYLCLGKDAFNSTDQQNIMNGETYFRIEGKFIIAERVTEVAVACVKGQRKVITADRIAYIKASQHVGKFPVVVISPDDHELISSGGETRRRWLDQTLSQTDAIYLDDLLQYAKVLTQRNAFLRQDTDDTIDEVLLDALDKQLNDYAIRLFEKRKIALTKILPFINQFYTAISGGREKINAVYTSQLFENSLYNLLKANKHKDRALQHTSCGIHRDDIEFELDNMTARKFGSQGQVKSLVCAVKLAQFKFTVEIAQKKAVLLLDDIFDKLDENRVRSLLNLLSGGEFGQVFITDAHKHRLEELFTEMKLQSKFFRVENGLVNTYF